MNFCKSFLLIFAFTFSLGYVFAQLDAPTPKPLIAPRRPAISPDGQSLAFVYSGDIWVVPISGGHAIRLTDNIEQDTLPVFSPDGQWIAFTSYRTGNADIFVIPVSGGTPRQISRAALSESASDWSPDGRWLIFSGQRDLPEPTLFQIDPKTLQFTKICGDYKALNYAAYSPDGKMVVYCRSGFPWNRPRYRGSASSVLWTIDLTTHKQHQLTNTDRQYLWPKFMPNGKSIVCVATGEPTPNGSRVESKIEKWVDNVQRTPNLWEFDLNGKGKRLTNFVGDYVKWPSVARATGDVVFEYGDGIWLLKKGAKEPIKLTIFAATDDKSNSLRRETLTNGVTEAHVSPDGKTMAFCAHGELWSVPIEKPKRRNPDDARRLTNYVGLDQDFCWSKDGKKIYFVSDREGSLSIFELDVETLAVKPLFKREGDIFDVRLTPDNKQLAFWVADEGLYLLPLEGGAAVKLIDIPGTGSWGGGGVSFSFSPDMRWVSYVAMLQRGPTDIWIKPIKGGEAINISKLNAFHGQVQWSPDGKYIFFQSSRSGQGIYVLPFQREEADEGEFEMKFEAPKDKNAVKYDIDFEDTDVRIRKLPTPNVSGNLTIGQDGTLYYISGKDVWSASYDGKDTKRLTNGQGVDSFQLMDDGKQMLLMKGDDMAMLNMSANNSVSSVTFSASFERDVRLERKAAFIQFWRGYNRTFYDRNFHGRDWDALRRKYEPLLDTVGTKREFADLLNMMVGELEASHSEVYAGNDGPVSYYGTPYLGFTYDYNYAGPGIRIKDVPQRAPGSYPKNKLNSGEYVMQVNGKDVRLDENLYSVINNMSGKDLTFLVNSKPDKNGARTVTYKALGGNWNGYLYINNLQKMRQKVDKRSGGKLAYIYIGAMMEGNMSTFELEFAEYTLGKEGAIIDIRGNGGGNIGDALTAWLSRKPYAYFGARGSYQDWPYRSWDKPTVLLIDERGMSDSELFTYNYRATGIGTIVGVPCPGYAIMTVENTLLDGTFSRMPGGGYYRRDGVSLENDGDKPDIYVERSAEDWENQRDPQLDTALDVLMKKIK
ncbi:MAG: S41 family peptidase [bacterium]